MNGYARVLALIKAADERTIFIACLFVIGLAAVAGFVSGLRTRRKEVR